MPRSKPPRRKLKSRNTGTRRADQSHSSYQSHSASSAANITSSDSKRVNAIAETRSTSDLANVAKPTARVSFEFSELALPKEDEQQSCRSENAFSNDDDEVADDSSLDTVGLLYDAAKCLGKKPELFLDDCNLTEEQDSVIRPRLAVYIPPSSAPQKKSHAKKRKNKVNKKSSKSKWKINASQFDYSKPTIRFGEKLKSSEPPRNKRKRPRKKRKRDVTNAGSQESPHGMENPENYCFVNAAIQTLVAHIDFVEELSDFCANHSQHQDLPLSRAFISIAATLANGETIASPVQLKEEMDKLTDSFAGSGQHDSAEFLDLFLTLLHAEHCRAQTSKFLPSDTDSSALEELDYGSIATLVSKCFQLKTKEFCTCGNCGHKR